MNNNNMTPVNAKRAAHPCGGWAALSAWVGSGCSHRTVNTTKNGYRRTSMVSSGRPLFFSPWLTRADPPYNTGHQDFIYDDCYIDTDDKFRHSKWLSFMRNRLCIAKKLLSTNAMLFVSIDDNELAALKILCDEIFGENCFLTTICVETSNGIFGLKAKHANKAIVKSKDYLLVYSMCKENLNLTALYSKSKKSFDTHFTLYKDDVKECPLNEWLQTQEIINEAAAQLGVKNNVANLSVIMDTFPSVNELILNNADKIYRIRDYTLKIDDMYKIDLESGQKVNINNSYVFYNADGIPLYLYPFSQLVNKTDDYDSQICSSVIVGDLWKGFNDDMGNVGKEGGVKFPNGKKPVRLIKNILKTTNNKSAIVLDFFAGSGTTGHAVMNLNAEDGGNRKFILCTNNENNICRDITYERIKRVIDKEDYAASLKYFRVEYIPISERMYYEYADELLKHTRELIELENGVNFKDNAEIGIVLTEEELDDFIVNNKAYGKCHMLYMGHDLLPDEEQEQFLVDHGIEIKIIPDYYYQDLQEA